MYSRKHLVTALLLTFNTASIFSQDTDSAFNLTCIVYDEAYIPIGVTHVINMNTHEGEVSDSLGIFSLEVHMSDTLFFRNIAYMQTFIPVAAVAEDRYVILKRIIYPLQEAKVFPWGSSYNDFSEAVINTPAPQTLGEALGLPRQDPDYIPFDMDEATLKSAGFLLSSPISFIYYNLSKREKNRRKLFWNEKNRELDERFDAIVSTESLSNITGLNGDSLLAFMAYLFKRMVCDYRCNELKIFSEIYAHWEVFQQLNPETVRSN